MARLNVRNISHVIDLLPVWLSLITRSHLVVLRPDTVIFHMPFYYACNYSSSSILHREGPPEVYHLPVSHPSSFGRYHGMVVSILLHCLESPAITASSASLAREAHDLYIRSSRGRHVHLRGIGYHPPLGSCVERDVGRSAPKPRQPRAEPERVGVSSLDLKIE